MKSTRAYEILGLLALLALVVLLPLYGLREPVRIATAAQALQEEVLGDAAEIYLDSCAPCHGPDGDGAGMMPGLTHPALASAHAEVLFRTIAYSPHGTTMAAWHSKEGGNLNSYQVQSLVTLIRAARWDVVRELAEVHDIQVLTPVEVADLAALEPAETADPHECRACHEEPTIHADRFGLNCARCHGMQAWKPALLTKHTFDLNHGGGGPLACQTCHVETYAGNTCYGCHDHQPVDMEAFHVEAGVPEFQDCATCHPTGAPGEAGELLGAAGLLPAADGPESGAH
jgi:mono/diheme cytochrome c family protein